jgi:hypothetical protein
MSLPDYVRAKWWVPGRNSVILNLLHTRIASAGIVLLAYVFITVQQ